MKLIVLTHTAKKSSPHFESTGNSVKNPGYLKIGTNLGDFEVAYFENAGGTLSYTSYAKFGGGYILSTAKLDLGVTNKIIKGYHIEPEIDVHGLIVNRIYMAVEDGVTITNLPASYTHGLNNDAFCEITMMMLDQPEAVLGNAEIFAAGAKAAVRAFASMT